MIIYEEENGYEYVSKRGIKYSLLEGVSLGTNRKITSDIVFITLLDPDYDMDNIVVGWLFGRNIFENNTTPTYEESIEKMVNEYEERNFEFD